MSLRISVDREKCQGYGQCEFAAADLFSLDESGTSVPATDVPDSRREDAERAADACPMQAITVE
jgi:ferredoxin